MKIVLSTLVLFAASVGQCLAQSCEAPESVASKIEIRYLEDVTRKGDGHVSHLAKYILSNRSKKAFKLAVYDGKQPLVAYPMDAMLERRSEGADWTMDFVALDHPSPADKIVKIAPGQTYEFLASGFGGRESFYRLKVRQPGGGWFNSEPFHFVISGSPAGT